MSQQVQGGANPLGRMSFTRKTPYGDSGNMPASPGSPPQLDNVIKAVDSPSGQATSPSRSGNSRFWRDEENDGSSAATTVHTTSEQKQTNSTSHYNMLAKNGMPRSGLTHSSHSLSRVQLEDDGGMDLNNMDEAAEPPPSTRSANDMRTTIRIHDRKIKELQREVTQLKRVVSHQTTIIRKLEGGQPASPQNSRNGPSSRQKSLRQLERSPSQKSLRNLDLQGVESTGYVGEFERSEYDFMTAEEIKELPLHRRPVFKWLREGIVATKIVSTGMLVWLNGTP
eukprot:gb/GECG01011164.1/.p1 GENE.gb/GECG01011164.1/~~gb/GECG01011164.1/.p1  ORF type:complete len:282 (+),score=34.56 gb/GECG01011164.1/:1-846(+)